MIKCPYPHLDALYKLFRLPQSPSNYIKQSFFSVVQWGVPNGETGKVGQVIHIDH